jgi:predicted nucleotide-binding protein
MARINSALIAKLEEKLGVGQSQIYRLIDATVRETRLPRNLAAVLLAMKRGMNISKYATDADLAQIRSAGAVTPQVQSITIPAGIDSPRRSQGTRGPRTVKPTASAKGARRRGTSVFVVHGRNDKIRRALFSFLRAVGLEPLEWQEAITKTGKGTPYVGEILDTAFREAVAVVVLLTPDDSAQLRREFIKPSDPGYERKPFGQARPNVLFEAGMAFGRNADSTVLVQVGETRPFSDIGGRHVVHLTNSPASRQELINRLANAGCNVNILGKTDWHTEGDFNL